ncbi:hypothetical protein LRR18_18755, partial [Mangrovimonas sp. AS39]|uniref:hypothetical protein n=1 Tax=Mangrovimonas futianensis TaxID=2895523 RepID=UPI001E602902
KLYVRSVEHHRRVSPNEFHLLVKGYLEHSIVGKDRIVYHCNKKISDLTKILADFLQKKHYNKKIKSRHYRKHFEMFLNNNNIKAGTRPVPATV